MSIWEKIKTIGRKIYSVLEDYGRRRAERAIALELAHFHRIEYRQKYQTNNPYSVMFSHDKY